MRYRPIHAIALAAVLAALLYATAAGATMPANLGSGIGYTPSVPVSMFARPAAWFDPSRLSISTSVSVGTGFSGKSEGLQVTSFGYRFAAPVWMNVSVGNVWGPSRMQQDGSALFLEGLDFGIQPFSMLQIQVHYRDYRSPLQYQSNVGPFLRGW